MQNFFYDDRFYYELNDLLEENDLDEDSINDLPEDHMYICYESKHEPIVTLNSHWICEHINDERFPEEPDSISERLIKVLDTNIDFAKVNALIPKLYYPTKVKFTITKQDIIDYCK